MRPPPMSIGFGKEPRRIRRQIVVLLRMPARRMTSLQVRRLPSSMIQPFRCREADAHSLSAFYSTVLGSGKFRRLAKPMLLNAFFKFL